MRDRFLWPALMFKYTEKKLAKEIGQIASAINPCLVPEYDPSSSHVLLSQGEDVADNPFQIFLGNIFNNVSEMPRVERLAKIEGFLREMLSPQELSSDAFMASLMLRVRTEFEVGLTRHYMTEMGKAPKQLTPMRHGSLLLDIVSDGGHTVSTIAPETLAENGVTPDEAAHIAKAAMLRSIDTAQWERIGESIWISSYEDDYDFSRVVAANEMRRFPFDGPAVVFVPSQSICLVTNNPTAETLTNMIEPGNEAAANHKTFSQLLWTVDEGNMWRRWHPDPTSDASEVAALQVLRETNQQYQETKYFLEQSIKDDVFIASYMPYEDENRISFYCSYSFDLPSYLPRTDFVVLGDPARPESDILIGRVDWNDFEECLGRSMIEQVEGIQPNWYRVMHPLEKDQKDRLRKLARPLT